GRTTARAVPPRGPYHREPGPSAQARQPGPVPGAPRWARDERGAGRGAGRGTGSEPAQDVAYLVQGPLHLGLEVAARHQVESLGVEVGVADRDRPAPRHRRHDLVEQPVHLVAVVTAAEAARLEATPELVEPGEFGVCGLVRPTHGWSVPRPGRAAHLRAGRRAGRAGGGPRAHAGRRDPGPGHRRRTGDGRRAT